MAARHLGRGNYSSEPSTKATQSKQWIVANPAHDAFQGCPGTQKQNNGLDCNFFSIRDYLGYRQKNVSGYAINHQFKYGNSSF